MLVRTHVQAFSGTGAGVLEGVIDLSSQFGALPTSIYAAFGAWPTGNGSSLNAATQVPVSVNGNSVLDASEFALIELCSLQPQGCCPADFNGDTRVDFFDYLDFVDALSAGLLSADFNGDFAIDFFDYLDLVDSFSVGC